MAEAQVATLKKENAEMAELLKIAHEEATLLKRQNF